MMNTTPLIVHIIHKLDFGGLENGLVNLINNMPKDRYRHAIVCSTDYTDFRKRIERGDVQIYALNKRPGNDISASFRLWKLLRKLKPDIVHTRNLGCIEYVVAAAFAGVKYRVHGEHGRDMSDIDGTNKKYRMLRRFCSLFINRFIALSKDLEFWLIDKVKIPKAKVTQLYNGVDLNKFVNNGTDGNLLKNFDGVNTVAIGVVGRLQSEKDQMTVLKAFAKFLSENSDVVVKLYLIGDGPDRSKIEKYISEQGLNSQIILLGARDDVPELLNELDLYVLPSLGEGISNTILESMASGLPVIATNVGGNPELVVDGETGVLVPAADVNAMKLELEKYINDAALRKVQGAKGRERVEAIFSLPVMVENYMKVYDSLLEKRVH